MLTACGLGAGVGYGLTVSAAAGFEVATRASERARTRMLDSIGLLALTSAVVALSGLPIELGHVVLLAVAAAGLELWDHRDLIPTGVPPQEVPVAAIVPNVFRFRAELVYYALGFALFYALVELLGEGTGVLIGFSLGVLLGRVVLSARVRRWQTKQHRTLLWLDDDQPGVAAQCATAGIDRPDSSVDPRDSPG